MAGLTRVRAARYGVSWPVRVRALAANEWSAGRSVNISTSGVLVQMARQYRIGEVVELEVDFLSSSQRKQTIGAIGRVIRTETHIPGRAAIRFDVPATAAIARAIGGGTMNEG